MRRLAENDFERACIYMRISRDMASEQESGADVQVRS